MTHETLALPGGARLTAYVPEAVPEIDADVRRPAILICPGGGYGHTSRREAEPVALRFAGMGFNTYVVWYRVAPARYPAQVQDAAAALSCVRRRAAADHTDPSRAALLGFSAGGHVAGSLGVLWPRAELWEPLGLTPEEVRPDALVLCYPVITGGEWAHRGSFEALTGSEDIREHEKFSLEKLVRRGVTPPTFLWHTWDDEAVPVMNTLLMAQALAKEGIPAEVRVYAHGVHGSSLCDETSAAFGRLEEQCLPDCQDWPRLAAAFLKRLTPDS